MNPLIASTSLTKIGIAFLLLIAGIGVALGIAMKDLKENDPATKGPKTKARKKMALGAVLTGAVLALVCLLAACSNVNPNRSFYDAQNPQPKAFYDWMDKVSVLAYQREINIDGDEDFFLVYWKHNLTPRAAIVKFIEDCHSDERLAQRNQKYNEAIWPYVPEP